MTPDQRAFLESASRCLLEHQARPLDPARKEIQVYIQSWGNYAELTRTVLLRSLAQPDNVPRLLDEGFHVSLDFHVLETETAVYTQCIHAFAACLSASQLANLSANLTPYKTAEEISRKSLLNALSRTSAGNAFMLLAAPDTFFGNGAISALARMGVTFDCNIAGAHLRIREDLFLGHLARLAGSISNAQLVGMAFAMPHQNTRDSFAGESSCSHVSGIVIDKLDDVHYVMTHRLPTIYLARPTAADVAFFESSDYNAWDHAWPSYLMLQGRYKLASSSDLFFAVELTDRESHHCPLRYQPRFDDMFYPNPSYPLFMHKMVNNHSIITLRADK